jgi:hypothetical protein
MAINGVAIFLIQIYHRKKPTLRTKPPKEAVIVPSEIREKRDTDHNLYINILRERLSEEDIDLGRISGATTKEDTFHIPGMLELSKDGDRNPIVVRRDVEPHLDEYKRIKARCEVLIETMMEAIEASDLEMREDFEWRS